MTILVFSILAILIGIIIICLLGDDNSYIFWGGVLCICGGIALGISIESNKKVPTALDVYRGKTTLEITYRDSIAIDSAVVFKK